MPTGSCEYHPEKKDLTVCGRERHGKEGSEGRTGRLRRLEEQLEGLLGPMKDPFQCAGTPGEEAVCPKAQRYGSVGEE